MNTKIFLTDKSRVQSFKLTRQKASKGKIFVSSKVTGKSVMVKNHWKSIIAKLENPITIKDLSKELKIDTSKVKVMILLMSQHRLIKSINGKELDRDHLSLKKNETLYCPVWVKYFLKKPLIGLYFLTAITAIVLTVFNPSFLPKTSDFFWHNRYSLSLFTFFIFSWIISLQHEIAHFITACSQGVQSTFNISYRLNFLVFQTSYPNIGSVSKKWRMGIFMSGIISDFMTLTALMLLVTILESTAQPAWTTKLIKQIILLEWLSVFWQFLFFMKTDIYYVFKELVGVENLYSYSKERIFCFLTNREFEHKLTKRENFYVNFYTFFFFLGTFLAFIRYGFFHLPITIKLFRDSVSQLFISLEKGDLILLADSLIILSIQTFAIGFLVHLIYKKKFGRGGRIRTGDLTLPKRAL